MKRLKEKINESFVEALKNKDSAAKIALSTLKTKITEAEKREKNSELSDAEITKIISSAIKQRTQSQEAFIKGGRLDLAEKEKAELEVLEKFLPQRMTKAEIESEIKNILLQFSAETNRNKKIGQTMGTFNKNFIGQADSKEVMEIINQLI